MCLIITLLSIHLIQCDKKIKIWIKLMINIFDWCWKPVLVNVKNKILFMWLKKPKTLVLPVVSRMNIPWTEFWLLWRRKEKIVFLLSIWGPLAGTLKIRLMKFIGQKREKLLTYVSLVHKKTHSDKYLSGTARIWLT